MTKAKRMNMKKQILLTGGLAVLLLAGFQSPAAEGMTRLYARAGSQMTIEGTATAIHPHWLVRSPLIGGYLEVGPGFPTEPGQAVTPGKIEATADTFIMVRSLKSIEPDGTPYSEHMDAVMYEHLRADKDPRARITYHLTSLVLKEAAKSKDAPYMFEAKGNLVVAGVTNQITMPVNVLPLGGKKVKISGTTDVKMTDFKVQPPAPIGILLKTGDDVKLVFEWIVAPRNTPAASASK
jgi:YceI-like domain